MRTIDELPVLDPYEPGYLNDPHGAHRDMMRHSPMGRTAHGLSVLGYRQVQTVLRDRRFQMLPGLSLRMRGITTGPLWDRMTHSILSLDGDEHQRLRRLVAQAFSPRAADDLRHAMRTTISDLLDTVDDECDVVQLVRSYPVSVICALLGMPAADWPFFSDIVDDVFLMFGPNVVADQPIILKALETMDRYIDDLVDARHAAGLRGDDLVTALIRAEDAGDRLDRPELHTLVGSLLGAGTDTTRNQLAAAIELLAKHSDQWALLRSDPTLIPGAVDEITRHTPVLLGTIRVATVDLTIDDVTVPAGTIIDVLTSAANRDPDIYPDPDTFDVTRPAPAPHLTFGGGIHYCLGVHLAKAELVEAITQMTARWSEITPAGPSPWKPRQGISGPQTLPVTLRAHVETQQV